MFSVFQSLRHSKQSNLLSFDDLVSTIKSNNSVAIEQLRTLKKGTSQYDYIKSTQIEAFRTVWIDRTPSLVLGNWKIGLYNHGSRTAEAIAESEAAGIFHERVWVSSIKRLRRFKGQLGWSTTDAYNAVSTATF